MLEKSKPATVPASGVLWTQPPALGWEFLLLICLPVCFEESVSI